MIMEKKRLIIIGAGGHGRVVADIARKIGYEQIAYLDDTQKDGVTGPVSDYVCYLDNAFFFVAIGDNSIREKLMRELQNNGANLASLIHPNAVISENVRIGEGTAIMAGAVVNTGTVIGDGVIINTCASVDHDCRIDDFVHVAVGAHVCGTVHVGARTWIGAGATVINNIDICASCMIGAGAVVTKNIKDAGVYIGIPAAVNGEKNS